VPIKEAVIITSIEKTKMQNCLHIVVTVEAFWKQLKNLKALGIVSRTSKGLGCYFVFAVRAMGLNKKIKKIWAQRWLGLSQCWLYLGEELTLLKALEILQEHGGMAATQKRAYKFRVIQQK
jgi:hypothetical protein